MGMTASSVPAERVRSGRWLVVAAMAVPLLMLTIDAFGLTVALPAIGHALDTTTTTLAGSSTRSSSPSRLRRSPPVRSRALEPRSASSPRSRS